MQRHSYQSVTVNQEAASYSDGFRVLVNKTGARAEKNFSVERMDKVINIYSIIRFSVILYGALALVFVICAAILLGYGYHKISGYAHSPIQNCTVIGVTFIDSSYQVECQLVGTNITDSFEISNSTFAESLYTDGSYFSCVHKDERLLVYSMLQDQFSQISKLWALGLLIAVGPPLCLLLFTLGTMHLVLKCFKMDYTYYPRDASHITDSQMVINGWGNLPQEAHQLVYLFLRTFYPAERGKVHNIAFEVVTTTCSQSCFKVFLVVLMLKFVIGGVFFIVTIPVWILHPVYQFDVYLGSLGALEGAICLITMAGLPYTMLNTRAFTIVMRSLHIEFNLSSRGIFGNFRELSM